MSFIQYSSIENHFSKYVDSMRSKYPELDRELFVVQQKYDGSNFQVIFSKNEPVEYASRNKLLSENDKFFGYKKILPSLQGIRKKVQDFLNSSEYETINLFGELYGSAVIKRIKYDEDRELDVKFFDVYFDRVVQSPKSFNEWARTVGIPDEFIVEHMTKEPVTLEQALSFDLDSVKTKCDDIIEGVVIKLNTFMQSDEDSQFVIKLKNSKYVEREHAPLVPEKKAVKKSEAADEGLTAIQRQFQCYVNQNRMLNSFAKQEWKVQEMKKLVDFVLEDGLKDFLKDACDGQLNESLTKEDLDQLEKLGGDGQNAKKTLDFVCAKKTQSNTFLMAKQMFK